jgi:hypothetical protein
MHIRGHQAQNDCGNQGQNQLDAVDVLPLPKPEQQHEDSRGEGHACEPEDLQELKHFLMGRSLKNARANNSYIDRPRRRRALFPDCRLRTADCFPLKNHMRFFECNFS